MSDANQANQFNQLATLPAYRGPTDEDRRSTGLYQALSIRGQNGDPHTIIATAQMLADFLKNGIAAA